MKHVFRITSLDGKRWCHVTIDEGWFSDTWHAHDWKGARVGREGEGHWQRFAEHKNISLFEDEDDDVKTALQIRGITEYPVPRGTEGLAYVFRSNNPGFKGLANYECTSSPKD